MNPAVLDHLTFLYGAAAARALQPQLEALLRQHAPRFETGTTPLSRKPLTQHDALLITYADQVREPGTPPLRTLAVRGPLEKPAYSGPSSVLTAQALSCIW